MSGRAIKTSLETDPYTDFMNVLFSICTILIHHLQANSTMLIGDDPDVSVYTDTDGGLFFAPIPGEMLRTPEDMPQVIRMERYFTMSYMYDRAGCPLH